MKIITNQSGSNEGRRFAAVYHNMIAKRDELINRYGYFFPTIMSVSPERSMYYRIIHVLAFRYSITHKNNIPSYRPYNISFNIQNPLK